ncbi:MAG: HNH endonuclease [Ignavibacteriales bacterium]
MNKSYEPISICTIKKAITLTFLQKAEVVSQNTSKFIHSSRLSIPLPSVIKLNYYVKRPYREVMLTRKNILRRDKHICAYCGRGDLPLTIDHIIPKSMGGEDTWENLITACLPCNNKKGNRTPQQAGMILHSKPYKPSFIIFLANSLNKVDDNWKTFLFQK